MKRKKYAICKSCGGPVKDYPDKKVVNSEFCPYCVDEQGELLGYKEILELMINYIKNDHPEIKSEKRNEKANEWLRGGPVWGEEFSGIIIRESLKNDRVLEVVDIKKEEISKDYNPETNGGFLIWHLLHVEFYRTELDQVIKYLKKDLSGKDWYADFKGKKEHYIIFNGKVFKCEIENKGSYKDAIKYGLKVGVPRQQLDFY